MISIAKFGCGFLFKSINFYEDFFIKVAGFKENYYSFLLNKEVQNWCFKNMAIRKGLLPIQNSKIQRFWGEINDFWRNEETRIGRNFERLRESFIVSSDILFR